MQTDPYLNKIRGSLAAGAAGDALGYTVEFKPLAQIINEYGPRGITAYKKDAASGTALISDDTQMTLFTANGILVADTMGRIPGGCSAPEMYVQLAYHDWLRTQLYDFACAPKADTAEGSGSISWLLDVPELFSRRAPGSTCLSALTQNGRNVREDLFTVPINNSKGCGGVMRVAPIGLHYHYDDIKKTDVLGAAAAAVTHGNSLGYMPAAFLTHVLNRIVYPSGTASLRQIIAEATETVSGIFAEDPNLDAMNALIGAAVSLAGNDRPDTENIRRLGEGWVAEETLAIALYCALRYEHDLTGGLIAAVNHDGDSDSTGAVTGNILGAINGFDALGEEWTKDLELLSILLEIADDLRFGCVSADDGSAFTPDWECKYLRMHRREYRDMISFG